MSLQSPAQVMGIDAGGTMTDTFFVRKDGRFVVGKAQSNPADESLAIFNSSQDALAHWDRDVDDVFPELLTCVYSGTAMLNRVVQRKGLEVGLIVNKGFEHVHSMGRAIQSYLGYALEERIHLNTHRYDEPLVPLSRTRGVTERTDVQGEIVIPLREAEVRQAVRDLVAAGSKALVIVLLQSHKNGASERQARDIALDELARLGGEVPVFASVDYHPQRKESHRMNTTILEAYAAEPSRQTLRKVSDRFKKHGAKFDLRVMATPHGGTISWKRQGTRPAPSCPGRSAASSARGCWARRWATEHRVFRHRRNLVRHGADHQGQFHHRGRPGHGPAGAVAATRRHGFRRRARQLRAARSLTAAPSSSARTAPATASAPAGRKAAWTPSRYRTATWCWATSIPTTSSAAPSSWTPAPASIKRQIADPLGLTVEDAAAGVIELLDLQLREYLRSNVSAMNYNPTGLRVLQLWRRAGAYLWLYRGAGLGTSSCRPGRPGSRPSAAPAPTSNTATTKAWTWRCHRSRRSPTRSRRWRPCNRPGNELAEKVIEEFRINGFKPEDVILRPGYRMQYMGQLNDLEIDSPIAGAGSADDWDKIVGAFEDTYGRVYASSARSPELGFSVTGAIMRGMVVTQKPVLPDPEAGPHPAGRGQAGHLQPYRRGQWHVATLWHMEALKPGNRIKGPAIVESDATTFVVPQGFGKHRQASPLFHLQETK